MNHQVLLNDPYYKYHPSSKLLTAEEIARIRRGES